MSRVEIARALGIAPTLVKHAVKRLRDEGRVELIGTGGATRYAAKADHLPPPAVPPQPDPASEGTLQGRILILLEDRSWASEEEIVQATGATPEEVEAVCAALVAEGEIEMRRMQGRDGYVVRNP